ncbi:MAG: hypothetical protein OEZ68_15560 [Gammaproteobacteria bacterium]|nr:hypothetical protein [Gammaproteobacteria bacterium]MDH5802219.1 hypothetical protein [Gammaproteobacteria bacterium]
MVLSAVITLKNDGAVYLLDSLTPDEYLTRQNIACTKIGHTAFKMATKSFSTDLIMDVFDLSNGISVGRIKYLNTLYHMVWADIKGNGLKVAHEFGNFIKQKSHSPHPALEVISQNFHRHTHDLGRAGYNVVTVSDLANRVYIGEDFDD